MSDATALPSDFAARLDALWRLAGPGCQFLDGDQLAVYRRCGAPRDGTTSYCTAHRARVTEPAAPAPIARRDPVYVPRRRAMP